MERRLLVITLIAVLLLWNQAEGTGKKKVKKNKLSGIKSERDQLLSDRRNSSSQAGPSGRVEFEGCRWDGASGMAVDGASGQAAMNGTDSIKPKLLYKEDLEKYASALGQHLTIPHLQRSMVGAPVEKCDIGDFQITLDQFRFEGWSSISITENAKGVWLTVVQQDFALCARLRVIAPRGVGQLKYIRSVVCVEPRNGTKLIYQSSFDLSLAYSEKQSDPLDSGLVLRDPQPLVEENVWTAVGPRIRGSLAMRLWCTIVSVLATVSDAFNQIDSQKKKADDEGMVPVRIDSHMQITDQWQ